MNLRTIALVFACSLTACIDDLPTNDTNEDPNEDGSSGFDSHASCDATMSLFPVVGAHNIGYDGSCSDGTCDVSCTGERANSDYGPKADGTFHHGIDVFAHRGATLVAVAAGHVVYAQVDKVNGSHEVKITDACGWSYFYGHLDTFAVATGDTVYAGQPVGTMGNTGTGGVHLHFNASPGAYSKDIDPLGLLVATSPTACGGSAPPPPPPPPPGCGRLNANEVLGVDQTRSSCTGQYTLITQHDGNVVLYAANNVPVFNTMTFGAGHQLIMQDDGNLVVYAGTTAVWNSRTNGHPGAYLEIGDGVLVVRSANGTALWTSH